MAALTPGDLATLALELTREDLQVYTVVRLAQIDLSRGHLNAALARLRVDADKLRAHDTPINEMLSRPT